MRAAPEHAAVTEALAAMDATYSGRQRGIPDWNGYRDAVAAYIEEKDLLTDEDRLNPQALAEKMQFAFRAVRSTTDERMAVDEFAQIKAAGTPDYWAAKTTETDQ